MKKKGIIICVCVIIGMMIGILIGWLCIGSVVSNVKEKDEIESWGVMEMNFGFYESFDIDFDVSEKLATKIGIVTLKTAFEEYDFSHNKFVVSEHEKEEIYIVSSVSKKNAKYEGGRRWMVADEKAAPCFNVAISKKDGAILKIWPGE